jgi:hypothetical protein
MAEGGLQIRSYLVRDYKSRTALDLLIKGRSGKTLKCSPCLNSLLPNSFLLNDKSGLNGPSAIQQFSN